MTQFQIFKQNTDAIATHRGFYYQYLKTVKLCLDNYVNGIDNDIYCEREDDIFEYNVNSEASIFRQIKCYSDTVGLNSPEIKGSLLHFYDIYQNTTYKKSEFYIESNQVFKARVGKSLKTWYERQKVGNFSILDSELIETRDILKSYVQDNLDKFLKKEMTKEEKEEAQIEVDDFKRELESDTFKTFVESLRWNFDEESNSNRAIANLSEDILKIISEKIKYDNRVDKELLLGYLVNVVLEKSIEPDETKRLLTIALLQEALAKTKIDDKLFYSEIKELLKSNFFIPHSLTEPFNREELFVGREDDFTNMREFLNTKNSLLLVHSIGGMGKTTLVKEFLDKEKSNYAHYAYLYAGEDIKQNWVNSGFRKSLSLVMEKTDDAFTESLVVIQALEGKTLLIIENIEKAENQEEAIEKIMGLAQNPNIDIVMTSREIIEDINESYELKSLSKEDAKLLFNSIYEVEDEDLLEEVLEFLDRHTFFIEKVAQTLKNKKGLLSLADIKEKFDKQEFPDIRLKKRNSFNDLLKGLFTLDELEEDEVLLLKQLSVLPSIDIEFDFLAQIFQVDDTIEFQEDLDFLNEKGWLIYAEGSYKLHQVIKEFVLLPENAPCFKEIEKIIDYFLNIVIQNDDVKLLIKSQIYINFLEELYRMLNTLNIENEKVVIFIARLARFYHEFGLYHNAEFLYKKVLNLNKNILNNDKSLLATIYNNLAELYRIQGINNDIIEISFLKSLEINMQIYEENHPSIAMNCNNLGLYYISQGNYEKALKFLAFSLKIYRKILDEKDLKLVRIYNNMAECYRLMNNNREALLFSLTSLNILMQNFEITHPDFANTYNTSGLINISLECYEKAEEYLTKSLYINQYNWSNNHITTAQSYFNLGTLFRITQNKKALELQHKALVIREKTLGKTHISIAESYYEISILYFEEKNYQKAYQFVEYVVEIYKEKFSSDNIQLITLENELKFLEEKWKENML